MISWEINQHDPQNISYPAMQQLVNQKTHIFTMCFGHETYYTKHAQFISEVSRSLITGKSFI